MQWYYVRNGKQLGPLTTEQMQQMVSQGELGSTDLIRRGDRGKPVPAGGFPDLFPASDHGPPPESALLSGTRGKLTLGLVGAGAALLVMFCGCIGIVGISGTKDDKAVRQELESAERFWTELNVKAESAKIYRHLLDARQPRLAPNQTALAYGRPIDFEADRDNVTEVKKLLDRAEKQKLRPTISSTAAKEIMAQMESERRRLAAEKQAQAQADREKQQAEREQRELVERQRGEARKAEAAMEGYRVEAWVAAQDLITNRLKSPSTADFGGILNAQDYRKCVTSLGDNKSLSG